MSKALCLYFSCLCSKNRECRILEENPDGIGLQIQKYHHLLTDGLSKNNVEVVAVSHLKGIEITGVKNGDSEEENGVRYEYICPMNKNALAYLEIISSSFKKTIKYLSRENAFVICDVLNASVSFGAVLAARLKGKEAIGIITDIPEMLTDGKKTLAVRLSWLVIKLCTSYVVLTQQMRDVFLGKKKKYIVLEGQVDSNAGCRDEEIHNNRNNGMKCIYAGGVYKKYGVEKLVKAFVLANVPDAELHIYGGGDYADELYKLESEKVFYHGIVPNEIVVEKENDATLLINPRPSNEEYTKYSFPSKNMEYMVSGTPVLTTKLPGMPEEYCDYVFLFEDETVEGMASTISKTLNLESKSLIQKGKSAKQFVLEKKNNIVQTGKILQMVLESK